MKTAKTKPSEITYVPVPDVSDAEVDVWIERNKVTLIKALKAADKQITEGSYFDHDPRDPWAVIRHGRAQKRASKTK